MRHLNDWLTVWTTTRAAGLTAYLLLFVSTVGGILTSMRLVRPERRAALLMLHQSAGWFGLLFGLLHGLVLIYDSYVGYSLYELAVPFAARDHRFLIGIGTLACYSSLLLVLSSDLAKRIGKRAWRAIHYLAFPGYFLALLHGFALGTDTRDGWVQGMYVATGLATLVLCGYRFAARSAADKRSAARQLPH
ncbi:ferric reductase-like transmembrane domain-containing protein [Cohnella nanjingensis]|uniref:Ferric reductase-like transmembrane domain-containing protein n=1 Tax=Cohnella nanjingensis TaxID=1387779 RepID=A0A7X0RUN1_9BACL|nr:ferric reductase-like transmembrane domain-containing protein [Cohnella nanjingensis]MBB6673851.1 ferric reductase-like transmembrane domain-containing protein [Cohnella nanjingensis]